MGTPYLIGQVLHSVFVAAGLPLPSAASKAMSALSITLSSINRPQLRDCGKLLGKLAPLIIHLILERPDTLWDDACYPVVQP